MNQGIKTFVGWCRYLNFMRNYPVPVSEVFRVSNGRGHEEWHVSGSIDPFKDNELDDIRKDIEIHHLVCNSTAQRQKYINSIIKEEKVHGGFTQDELNKIRASSENLSLSGVTMKYPYTDPNEFRCPRCQAWHSNHDDIGYCSALCAQKSMGGH